MCKIVLGGEIVRLNIKMQKLKLLIRALILNLPFLTLAAPAFAQVTFDFKEENIPFANLGELLANALILLFALAAILSFVFIVIGGIQWITAGGDKVAAQSARDRITAAVVGLLIVVAAFAITLIVTTLFGINIFTGEAIDFCKFAPSTQVFPGACP